MQLRSGVAVAVAQAGRYSSNSTPSLGTSICCGCGPKKKKAKMMTMVETLLVLTRMTPPVVSQGENCWEEHGVTSVGSLPQMTARAWS